MESDKNLIVKGLKNLAIALPLMFAGPSFYFWVGVKSIQSGTYIGLAISLVLMAAAVFFMVRGIRLVLRGFFR